MLRNDLGTDDPSQPALQALAKLSGSNERHANNYALNERLCLIRETSRYRVTLRACIDSRVQSWCI